MSHAECATGALVALHVAFPAAIDDDIVDFCHAHAELITGFTLSAAEGFGENSRLHLPAEIVLGRARRRVLTSILPAANVDPVLDALRASLPSPEIVYWTTIVTRFGRLA
jgi:hypothetical protein